MLITTQDKLEEFVIERTLGLVRGNAVRARFFGKDIVAGLRNLVGGEVKEYTELMAQSREQAIDRMVAEAQKLGADAIVAVRLTTATISEAASEQMAYGTAVKLRSL
ncbi:MAG: YbjQ family protein [Neisseria sp.]|nr:YbjQ family protein [Neisseria sp.]